MRTEVAVLESGAEIWHCKIYDAKREAIDECWQLIDEGFDVKIRTLPEDENTEEKKCVTV